MCLPEHAQCLPEHVVELYQLEVVLALSLSCCSVSIALFSMIVRAYISTHLTVYGISALPFSNCVLHSFVSYAGNVVHAIERIWKLATCE